MEVHCEKLNYEAVVQFSRQFMDKNFRKLSHIVLGPELFRDMMSDAQAICYITMDYEKVNEAPRFMDVTIYEGFNVPERTAVLG